MRNLDELIGDVRRKEAREKAEAAQPAGPPDPWKLLSLDPEVRAAAEEQERRWYARREKARARKS